MPFGLGPGELIAILLIVLLLFGAKRIPEIAGSMGKGIKEFKRNMTEAERAIREPGDAPRRDVDAPARSESLIASPDDPPPPEPKRLLS